MDVETLILKVAPLLDLFAPNYFITGGVAVSIWGRPRATFDIDIVVQLLEPKVVPLLQALRKISRLNYVSEEAAYDAIRRKSEFNFIDTETNLKVDFWIMKQTPAMSREFQRRVSIKLSDQTVYFISPGDLILSKLDWYQQSQSTRHLEDIESIIRLSRRKLDKNYLATWAKRLGTWEVLEKLWNK